ncbi:MAG TPA: choice-of-anchor D domain-containing protein [Blastocatellia bacterium]|nr:choice-of-anchor D domain-containing protein [Blastocatellia bacterium]
MRRFKLYAGSLAICIWLCGQAMATPSLKSSSGDQSLTSADSKQQDQIATVLAPRAAEDGDRSEKKSGTAPDSAGSKKEPVVKKQDPAARQFNQSLRIQSKGLTIRYPDTWSAESRFANSNELYNLPADASKVGGAARIKIFTEQRRNHQEALRRLKEIRAEYDSPVNFLEIGGWPALQRRQITDMYVPRREGSVKVLRITTAIAADTQLVRIEGTIPVERTNELAEQVEAIGRGASFDSGGSPDKIQQEIEQLRRAPSLQSELLETVQPSEQPQNQRDIQRSREQLTDRNQGARKVESVPATVPSGEIDQVGFTQRLGNGSELEIAVSPNGRNIVVATNSGYSFSNDGGLTFTINRQVNVPMTFNRVNGDPSLAVGRSGTFYYALIGFPTATSNSTAMFVSTDNGQNFNFRANAVNCGGSGVPAMPGPGLCFADQEHIAADRFNAGPMGGDQVYSAWRNFDGSDSDPALVCSSNSGQTWTAPIDVAAGAFPRVGVGQDGFVYVIYRSGGNIMLHKYSSCANGLAAQMGFPVVVSAVTDVACPLPGLDRCNGRNVLSSQTVAVDDTNPNHVYVAYATNTVAPSATTLGNTNIIVRDSADGGATWPAARNVVLNSGAQGPRFMPWVCTVGGAAHVSWYDRRPATLTSNDLTDFFGGSAFLDGGNLVAGPEFKISGAADPQCASGWPSAVDNMNDSESCSVQPQLGGRCLNAMGMGSNTPCDFSSGGCPVGETCQNGRGAPKYGDYNGTACAAGRFYAAWASATTQPGATPPVGIDTFFSSKIVCCVPQIQIPSNPNFPAITCVGSSSAATLNVCNTGKADLEVTSITSSNTQFSVTTPSAGFPVIISPDFCFPFEARFTPTSGGSKTTTLTINSNDPVNPALMRTFSAQGGQATIVVNDPVTFDKTCPGNVNNKILTIGNSGSCDLIVSGITSNSPLFKVIGVVPFPLVIPPGATRDVVIQFMPMGFTVDPMQMATLTIMSNDPVTPNKNVKVVGTVPPPVIQAAPDPLDFGEVCLNKSKTLPLVIRNAGECNLTVSGITFSSTEFKLVSPPTFPFVILPGGSRTVMVSFMPVGATGPRMATMTINSDDPVTPMKVVSLKGVAPVSAIEITGSMNFGMVKVGKFKDQFLNISNTAPCDLLITLICEVTDNGPIQMPSTEFDVIAPITPKLIPGGGTLPVQIRFKPQKKGNRTAKLIVFGHDPATSTILLMETFLLKGVGN